MSDNDYILVIEDDEAIQIIVKDILASVGYKIKSAANGLEGMLLLHSEKHLPRLILLDLMMPKMDGFEFRNEQLHDPRIDKIPVLL